MKRHANRFSLYGSAMPACDRRAGMERRQFCYAFHLPERRLRMERRTASAALLRRPAEDKREAWGSIPSASRLRRN